MVMFICNVIVEMLKAYVASICYLLIQLRPAQTLLPRRHQVLQSVTFSRIVLRAKLAVASLALSEYAFPGIVVGSILLYVVRIIVIAAHKIILYAIQQATNASRYATHFSFSYRSCKLDEFE